MKTDAKEPSRKVDELIRLEGFFPSEFALKPQVFRKAIGVMKQTVPLQVEIRKRLLGLDTLEIFNPRFKVRLHEIRLKKGRTDFWEEPLSS